MLVWVEQRFVALHARKEIRLFAGIVQDPNFRSFNARQIDIETPQCGERGVRFVVGDLQADRHAAHRHLEASAFANAAKMRTPPEGASMSSLSRRSGWL